MLIGTNTLSRWKVRRDAKMLSQSAPTVGLSPEMPGPTSRVDKTLPWVAVIFAVALVIVTVLSPRAPHLPGIALESKPLFLIHRGVAVLAALVVAITLLARTFKRELPTGLSTAIASVKYAETVEAAASSSDAIMADLKARLDEQDTKELMQDEKLTTLTNLVDAIAAVVRADERPNPPGR